MKRDEMKYDNKETDCCALIDPERWDCKRVVFEDRLFMKKRVRAIFRVPINFGGVMKEICEQMDSTEAYQETWFTLSDENSLWGSDLYVAVDKEVPGAEMVKLSGVYFTKVFEGPYKNVWKWMKEMEEYVKSKEQSVKKMYFFYTSCPECSKHFGKNYVILFAQV